MENIITRNMINGLFAAGVLRCRHVPTLELRVPDHPVCQACCQWQLCETHDPANPEFLNFKMIFMNTPAATTTPTPTAVPTPTATTSGQCDDNVQAGNADQAKSNAEYLAPRDPSEPKDLLGRAEEVDDDFSITRDGSTHENSGDLTDPTGNQLNAEPIMVEVEHEDEVLRDAGGPMTLERQPLELDSDLESSRGKLPVAHVLVTEPDGKMRLPSNSSRHELDMFELEERRSVQAESLLDYSSGSGISGEQTIDLTEPNFEAPPALSDSDSDDLGIPHSTPRPCLSQVRHIKRKVSNVETSGLTSKKPRMAEPVPSSSTFRIENVDPLWVASASPSEAIALGKFNEDSLLDSHQNIVKKFSNSMKIYLMERDIFESTK